MNDEWVRYKDQKPEDGNYVLAVWMPKGMIPCVARGYFPGTMYVVKYENEEFDIPSVYNPLPATHWMPLPELPSENE